MFTINFQTKISYKIVRFTSECVCVTLLMIASTVYKGISLKLLFVNGLLYRKTKSNITNCKSKQSNIITVTLLLLKKVTRCIT